MIKEAIKADTGILFDERKLNLYGLALPTQYGGSNVGGEPDGDACFYLDAQNRPDRIAESRASDVKASSHVDYSPFWWPLEFLPVLERKQADLGKWVWQPQYVAFGAIDSLAISYSLVALTCSVLEPYHTQNRLLTPKAKKNGKPNVVQGSQPQDRHSTAPCWNGCN